MRRIDQSTRISVGIYGMIFLMMFVFNRMALFIFDDFLYLYSFADKTRIHSVAQIFPSMATHIQSMNGRTIAHFLVQLFLLLPMWVFDLVNAGMFVLMIWSCCAMAGIKMRRSNLLCTAVFCAFWVYTPVFGQVILWQDGASSYLWASSIGFALLYLTARECLFEPCVRTIPAKVGFLILSILAGGYLEATSAGVLCGMFLLTGMGIVLRKRSLGWHVPAGLAVAFLGFVSMFLSPGEMKHKPGMGFTRVTFTKTVIDVTQVLSKYAILVYLFVGMLVLALLGRANRRRILLAIALFASALAANYIHVFADHYPPRSSMGMVSLLICANAVILRSVMEETKYMASAVVAAVFAVVTFFPKFLIGFQDISLTYVQMRNNETAIAQALAEGHTTVAIPDVTFKSEYSIRFGADYIKEDPAQWPNTDMAKYYGIDVIVGIPQTEQEEVGG